MRSTKNLPQTRRNGIARGISSFLLALAVAVAMAPHDAAADQIAYITGGTDIWG